MKLYFVAGASGSGKTAIMLDTWDFQAPDFYLKSGYKLMGEIKKYWREHSRIFLKKIL